jgi:competence CoiA-like predicted nuclease
MGFTARRRATGELISILDFPNPRMEIEKEDIECHLCKGDLIIKDGLKRIKHFAHKPNSPCSCDYDRHPESYEHLFFKRLIAENLGQEFSEYLGVKPILEYPIHEVRRIADIVFEFPSGWLVAHEIQLAGITTEQLEERTNDYRNAGVDVIWWLGKTANTRTNREWVTRTFGECYVLDYESVRQHREEENLF